MNITHATNRTHVTGTVAELLDYALPRIRRVSHEFYSREIPADLARDGKTLIDRHAIGVLTVMTVEENGND